MSAHDDVVQEPDVLPRRRTVIITAATVVTIIVSVLIAGLILRLVQGPAPLVAEPQMAPREIAGIEQTQIMRDGAGLRLNAAQRRSLEAYGWVNRERGLVHIPIERAIELVTSGKAP